MNWRELLDVPVNQWAEVLETVKGDRQELEAQLSAVIQRATLAEAYLSHRFNSGCGDQGHEASAKQANRVLVKVRKALGFSYPSNTPLSI